MTVWRFLSSRYNLALHRPGGTDFGNLHEGLQTLGGVLFDVRGAIQLTGQIARKEGYTSPERVNGIRIGQKCRELHFLQGSGWSAENGALVGSYVLHYADGEQRELPVQSGRDIGDWWREMPTPIKDAKGAVVVWNGWNQVAARTGNTLWLYKSTRENPRPDVELISMDFLSAMSPAAPFLVALTIE